MPSGITCRVHDGSESDVRAFLWRVAAQQFYHAEIPTLAVLRERLTDSFEHRHLEELRRERAALDEKTDEQLEREDQALRERAIECNKRSRAEREVVLARYRAMEEKVVALDAPSVLDGTKQLALRLLRESIEWDCRGYDLRDWKKRSSAEIRKEKVAYLDDAVGRAEEWLAEQIKETQETIDWYEAAEKLLGPRPKGD